MQPKPPEKLPPKDDNTEPTAPVGEPVADPSPPMDGKKPIPAGDKAMEKFMVATDTAGGD